jgi:hypothetical protein
MKKDTEIDKFLKGVAVVMAYLIMVPSIWAGITKGFGLSVQSWWWLIGFPVAGFAGAIAIVALLAFISVKVQR